MKSVKLIAAVFSLHIFVVIALLMQPGCQSVSRRHASSKTITIHEQMNASVHEDFNAGMTESKLRSQPTRPTNHVARGEDTQIDEELLSDVLEPLNTTPKVQIANVSSVSTEQEEMASYEVKRGDNLWVISKKVGVPLSIIAKANNLSQDSILQIGQKLSIPKATTSVAHSQVASASASVQSQATSEYLVQRGDTLSTIASNTGSSVSGIKSANGLRSNVIYVGQKLKIPGSGAVNTQPTAVASTRPAPQPGDTYTVRPGQTLSDIAQITGVRVTELMEYNGINDPRRLRADQVLKLKSQAAATSMASSSQAPSVVAPRVIPQETASQQKQTVDMDSFFDNSEEIPWVPVETVGESAT